MPEIGSSGLMSGGGKRGVGHRPQATAPILDSTVGDIRSTNGSNQEIHLISTVASSHPPLATNTPPATRAIVRPVGITFSRRTNIVRTAIQSRFITPPTKSSAIKAQQQPTQ